MRFYIKSENKTNSLPVSKTIRDFVYIFRVWSSDEPQCLRNPFSSYVFSLWCLCGCHYHAVWTSLSSLMSLRLPLSRSVDVSLISDVSAAATITQSPPLWRPCGCHYHAVWTSLFIDVTSSWWFWNLRQPISASSFFLSTQATRFFFRHFIHIHDGLCHKIHIQTLLLHITLMSFVTIHLISSNT